jgi:hypothetical protein
VENGWQAWLKRDDFKKMPPFPSDVSKLSIKKISKGVVDRGNFQRDNS